MSLHYYTTVDHDQLSQPIARPNTLARTLVTTANLVLGSWEDG